VTVMEAMYEPLVSKRCHSCIRKAAVTRKTVSVTAANPGLLHNSPCGRLTTRSLIRGDLGSRTVVVSAQEARMVPSESRSMVFIAAWQNGLPTDLEPSDGVPDAVPDACWCFESCALMSVHWCGQSVAHELTVSAWSICTLKLSLRHQARAVALAMRATL
jgi:hypothetical protein